MQEMLLQMQKQLQMQNQPPSSSHNVWESFSLLNPENRMLPKQKTKTPIILKRHLEHQNLYYQKNRLRRVMKKKPNIEYYKHNWDIRFFYLFALYNKFNNP